MPYRICKTFEIENAHMLFKHPEKCRHPHGHSRTVEVIVAADALDANDMVCDFKALKLAIGEFIDSFDHAICVNARDPLLPALKELPGARVIVYDEQDPTTEVMARHMFVHIRNALQNLREVHAPGGPNYKIGAGVRLEKIRIWETSSSWGEYWE